MRLNTSSLIKEKGRKKKEMTSKIEQLWNHGNLVIPFVTGGKIVEMYQTIIEFMNHGQDITGGGCGGCYHIRRGAVYHGGCGPDCAEEKG